MKQSRSRLLLPAVLLPVSVLCGLAVLACGKSSPSSSATNANGGQVGTSGGSTGLGSAGLTGTTAGAGGMMSVGGSAAVGGVSSGGVSPSGGMNTGGISAGGGGGPSTSVGGSGGSPSTSVGGGGGSGGSMPGADAGVGCTGDTLCFDFDDGQVPTGWAPVTNSGAGSIVVDTTKPHNGTHSLHVMDASGDNPMHSLGFTLPQNFGGTMWGRVYLYLTPEGPTQHGAIVKARYADAADTMFGPENLDWYETGVGHGSYEAIWHEPQPPTGLPEWEMISDTPITLDQWFCEEFLFDGANPTGAEAAEPRVWVEGTELPFPDKHLYPGNAVKPVFDKATNFILVELGLIMYHPLNATTNLWIDDFAIGPQRVGCQ
ncbi:MAG TPA: hypothetical protein VL137_02080 [Polyangiaceae bacterium]|nr:hypothetical protein [Polyangiaceae bacterium]